MVAEPAMFAQSSPAAVSEPAVRTSVEPAGEAEAARSVRAHMSDGDTFSCGACGDLIGEYTFSACEQCGCSLHKVDECPDVWQPHQLYKFCSKACAVRFQRANPSITFELVQRRLSGPATASMNPAGGAAGATTSNETRPAAPAAAAAPVVRQPSPQGQMNAVFTATAPTAAAPTAARPAVRRKRVIKEDEEEDGPAPLLPVGTGCTPLQAIEALASADARGALAAAATVLDAAGAAALARPLASAPPASAVPDPMDTPRSKLLPPPATDAPLWQLKPRRIGSDAAVAGHKGAASACGLQPGEYKPIMCSVHVERGVTQNKHQGFADPENAAKMNADIERLKRHSITEELARQGKKLLVSKYEAMKERAGAAYFSTSWQDKQWTFAEANAPCKGEEEPAVRGGVPPQSNALERQNGQQKHVLSFKREQERGTSNPNPNPNP